MQARQSRTAVNHLKTNDRVPSFKWGRQSGIVQSVTRNKTLTSASKLLLSSSTLSESSSPWNADGCRPPMALSSSRRYLSDFRASKNLSGMFSMLLWTSESPLMCLQETRKVISYCTLKAKMSDKNDQRQSDRHNRRRPKKHGYSTRVVGDWGYKDKGLSRQNLPGEMLWFRCLVPTVWCFGTPRPTRILYYSTTFQAFLPLSLTLKGRKGGSARPSATIASHPRRLCVTVARPSDGPTDPSRRSRRADHAFQRETNKIIKGDRRARRASHLRASAGARSVKSN